MNSAMKVTGSTIQQLDKDKPHNRCRRWHLWTSADQGRKLRRFRGTWMQAQEALKGFVAELEDMAPNADTFEDHTESWAERRAESGRYSPNTVVNEASRVKILRHTPLDGPRMDEVTRRRTA